MVWELILVCLIEFLTITEITSENKPYFGRVSHENPGFSCEKVSFNAFF